MWQEIVADEDGQSNEVINNTLEVILEGEDVTQILELEIQVFSQKR